MDITYLYGQELTTFSLEKKEGKYVYTDSQGTLELDVREIAPGVLSILVGEKSILAAVVRDKDRIVVAVEGCRFEFQEASSSGVSGRAKEETAAKGLIEVKAPMPGRVVRVSVSEGEKVRKNQTLAIVEAMKMENEIKALVEGVIKKIHVSEGELVDSEKALLELEASPSP